jgi:hypothetical protein
MDETTLAIGRILNASIQESIKDPRYCDTDPVWFKFHCPTKEMGEKLLIELNRFAKLVLDHDDFIHSELRVEIDDYVVLLSKETNQKTEQEILKWKSAGLKRRIQNGI